MKHRLLLCLIFLFAVASTQRLMAQDTGQPLSWADDLRQRLTALNYEFDRVEHFTGICVYDLTADQPLYSRHAHKVMRPASTQKILTAVAALDRLGKNYAFRTMAVQTGYMEGTTLMGNVVIRGGFDPMFSYGDLRQMARAIREAGIDSIGGQLIGDVSMTDGVRLGNGWCWDDVPSSTTPYLTPLFFNHEQEINSRNTKCVERPEDYFLRVLLKELREAGVAIRDGALSIALFPQSAATSTRTLFTTEHTIEQMLGQMMKKSDNLYAEALFYLLGSSGKFSQTGWKDGAKQVEAFMQKIGVNMDNVVIADGSGLSLYNYVSPQDEVKVLCYAYQQPAIYTTLSPSLPVAGVDGTLERRMKSGPAFRNVRAKTGSVKGVFTLAGYVTASNGHILAFSIMNNGAMKGDVTRELQDRFCQELAK
ncbi:MAG: D-alanyl-D-alanine carboxypeptidase/D-alanyl-D-alanine-endopeptidase [Bacteroidaceae bacterium]|nr:D-alanyl-D-alanine carboxypeptidase/D-alanyl-D-alanine-endopeptidase [Bacteroidaceae bacterium]